MWVFYHNVVEGATTKGVLGFAAIVLLTGIIIMTPYYFEKKGERDEA